MGHVSFRGRPGTSGAIASEQVITVRLWHEAREDGIPD